MAEARASGKKNITRVTVAVQILLGAIVSLAPTATAQPAQRGLDALTVPVDRLPSDCQLKPSPEPKTVGSVVVGVPPMLSRNPWIGEDRWTVAMIHSLVDDGPRVPDGQPLDRRGATQYALEWAAGVVNAYRAAYVSQDLTDIDVYAVRFDNGTLKARVFARNQADTCFQAVRTYVQSVK